MKLIALFAVLLSLHAIAGDYPLDDYNVSLPDVRDLGKNREQLFQSMERVFVRTGPTICSNRAHVWSYDLSRKQGVESGKIFIFFTGKIGGGGDNGWWYHVAPVINEKGDLWVMDAGFRMALPKPLKAKDWFKYFAGTSNCKQIHRKDEDVLQAIYTQRWFPRRTSLGTNDCYYHVSPWPYWTPNSVANHLLGRDMFGNSINFYRDTYDQGELLQACLEVSTMWLTGHTQDHKNTCLEYLGLMPRS